MKVFCALASLALASASQDIDETAYLLQTKANQKQKLADAEDCYVSGGCSTTPPPPTPPPPTPPPPTPAPTTTTTITTTTTTPTTTSTTTTTTTTTTTSTTPSTGAQSVPPPPGHDNDCVGDCDHQKYCEDQTPLDVSDLVHNNLGGMGPNFNDPRELKYANVIDGVDLVITALGDENDDDDSNDAGKKGKKGKGKKNDADDDDSADAGKKGKKGKGKKGLLLEVDSKPTNPYYQNNWDHTWRGKTGQGFAGDYNGNEHRDDVIGIGSLAVGSYPFRFCFVNNTDDSAVTLPYVPMTFYDLDGKDDKAPLRYEEVSTDDAEGIEGTVHSLVDYRARPGSPWGCKAKAGGGHRCSARSANQEIQIPEDFDHLTPQTQKASITMMFKDKSCFDITYTLNYPHRVFLFKGQCF